MKPGMKMMLMERARQGNQNDDSSNRRMIGFERDAQRERSRSENVMPYIPPMEAYGDRENYSRYRNNEQERPDMGGYENYAEREMAYDRNRSNREHNRSNKDYPRGDGYNESPESRRRRDKRGRFMMGGMEYDEDDEEDDRPKGKTPTLPPIVPPIVMPIIPSAVSPAMPPMRGNTYGDIYAEGTIWAPGAMNRPSNGMMSSDSSGDMSAPVDEHTAKKWVDKMSGGEHFKMDQAEQYRNALCPDCDKWEFFVTINAVYSDYCETAKKMNVDKPEFYASLAKDFLKDKDAGPHKLRKYMETIPKN